uniref:AIG1-type G domain-containing protein n=1 Tax=Pundamilia nyererei TaxID=303518 RepID=A0A3B4G964_9CICH
LPSLTPTGRSRQTHDSPELRIVLIGGRELTGEPSNKSLSGNIILGQNVFDTSRRTAQSVAGQQEVHGRRVTVVDTPGWWWHYPLENTPKLDQIEIQNSVHLVSMCAPGPHVFLLVVPISKAFTEEDHKALVELLMPFGERVWRHCIVLFTWGDWLNDRLIEEHIAGEGKSLQWLVEKCGYRYHVLNCHGLGYHFPVKLLFQKIIDLITRNKEQCPQWFEIILRPNVLSNKPVLKV